MRPEQENEFNSHIDEVEKEIGRPVTRDEFDRFHNDFISSLPKEAPNAVLRGIDKIADYHPMMQLYGAQVGLRNKAMGAVAEKFPRAAKVADTVLSALPKGANWLMKKAGVDQPEEIALGHYLPNTSKVLNTDVSAADLLTLAAFEGLGRSGSALKAAGERGKIKAFNDNKPSPPPGASPEMAQQIRDRKSLALQEAARNTITDAMLKLREKGVGASQTARDATNPLKIKITPERINQLHEFFPDDPMIKNLKARLDAAHEGKITQDFVETKPGETVVEKKLTPSEVVQSAPEQRNLFDEPFLNDVEASTKNVPDFVAHPDRGISPAAPEIQRPIEPNLEGQSSKIPANYQVVETQIPPEGHYEFAPENLYDYFSRGNSEQKMWGKNQITHEMQAKSKRFGDMMSGLREDLRSVQEPLTPQQLETVKQIIPEFEGSTVGDAVKHLNGVTTEAIGTQRVLGKKKNGPLSFMANASKNGDARALLEALEEKHGIDAPLKFADQYGASRDYAKQLMDYETKFNKPFSGILPLTHKVLFGGPDIGTAMHLGELLGTPSLRASGVRNLGRVVEKVKPSAYFNLQPTIRGTEK